MKRQLFALSFFTIINISAMDDLKEADEYNKINKYLHDYNKQLNHDINARYEKKENCLDKMVNVKEALSKYKLALSLAVAGGSVGHAVHKTFIDPVLIQLNCPTYIRLGANGGSIVVGAVAAPIVTYMSVIGYAFWTALMNR